MATQTPTASRVNDALQRIARTKDLKGLQQAFLETAPRIVDAGTRGIYTLDAEVRTVSVHAVDVPSGFLDAYEDLGRPNDVMFRHIVEHRAPAHDATLAVEPSWPEQPGGGAFLDAWGFAHVIQAPVFLGDRIAATLHFGRRKPGRAFGQSDVRAAAMAATCVARQLDWIQTEDELRRTRSLCSALLEQIGEAAVVTTETGSVIDANRAAKEMLLCYRTGPQLWDGYAAAVRRNAASIAAGGGDDGGTTARRGRTADIAFTVRTSPMGDSDLLLSRFHPRVGDEPARKKLGAREQAIACLIADGHSNDEIAEVLGLSVNTVKDRLKRVNRKLGIMNRAQLAAWAQRNCTR